MRVYHLLSIVLPLVSGLTFVNHEGEAKEGASWIVTWQSNESDPDTFFLCLGPDGNTGPYDCRGPQVSTADGGSPYKLPNVPRSFYRFYATKVNLQITLADILSSSDPFPISLNSASQDAGSSNATSTTRPLVTPVLSPSQPPVSASPDSGSQTESTSSTRSPAPLSRTTPAPSKGVSSAISSSKGPSSTAVALVAGILAGVGVLSTALVALVRWKRRKKMLKPYPFAVDPEVGYVKPKQKEKKRARRDLKLKGRMATPQATTRRLQLEIAELQQSSSNSGPQEVRGSQTFPSEAVARQVQLLQDEVARINAQMASYSGSPVLEVPPPLYDPEDSAVRRSLRSIHKSLRRGRSR